MEGERKRRVEGRKRRGRGRGRVGGDGNRREESGRGWRVGGRGGRRMGGVVEAEWVKGEAIQGQTNLIH